MDLARITDTSGFIHNLRWQQIPDDVRHCARRSVLDTLGTAISATKTKLSRTIYDFAALMYGGKGCHLWLDGREVSPIGAVLAHGMTIDALDIHDNCNAVKGHAGVAIVPTVFAVLEWMKGNVVSGEELLTAVVVGYEIAIRAGLALHATACDYHSSGAWNALGCAAVASRWLGLNTNQTRHALGIAEYHGPRSQMMRVIDHPTMLKDGSGWGAMAGVSAAWLANDGFTGAPAITVESAETAFIWADLGKEWHMRQQDYKQYAVCHWAQPAISGTLKVMREQQIAPEQISRLLVFTFHEATRLDTRRPADTEQAQYSLRFPVAAAVFHDCLGVSELSEEALVDPRVLDLAGRVELIEDAECNARFPQLQTAHVTLETTDGRHLDSGIVMPPWDVHGIPATDEELLAKFRWLVADRMPDAENKKLEELLWHLDELSNAKDILRVLAAK